MFHRRPFDINVSRVIYFVLPRYSRSQMKEGAKNLPWEKEAYTKTKK